MHRVPFQNIILFSRKYPVCSFQLNAEKLKKAPAYTSQILNKLIKNANCVSDLTLDSMKTVTERKG